jgi:hypothetical protein
MGQRAIRHHRGFAGYRNRAHVHGPIVIEALPEATDPNITLGVVLVLFLVLTFALVLDLP